MRKIIAATLVALTTACAPTLAPAATSAFCQTKLVSEMDAKAKDIGPQVQTRVLTKDEAARLVREYNEMAEKRGQATIEADEVRFYHTPGSVFAYVVFSKDGCVSAAGRVNLVVISQLHPWRKLAG